ncbi:MAG: hypothetical protein KDD94_08670 [Calditrichaeota bacterium]|nr:hypothetical protein [Calditrichota bacterium]
MKYLFSLVTLSVLVAQVNREITVLASFADFQQIKDTDFYLAWELPVNTENHQSFYHFKSFNDDDYLMFDQLLSNPNHAILFLSFDHSKTDIDMVATFKSGKQGIFKRKPLYWIGLQEVESSYRFVMDLMKTLKEDEKLYSLLNVHQKDKETLDFYKKRFADANSNRGRKDLIFWIGAIRSIDAAKELDRILDMDISLSLKEQVMFAYSRNRTEYAMRRLISISKDDQISGSVRKKAKFWLANAVSRLIESKYSQEVYSGDDLEVRESAVFALYNMHDYNALKDIATKSKDVRLRKKAIFWLGQIDQTPVDFFEKLLNL